MYGLSNAVAELLVTIAITLAITLFYRFLVNQVEARELKLNMKEKQSKMRELQKTSPSEANKVATEMMSLSGKQMKMTLKPMLMAFLLVGISLPVVARMFPGPIVNLPFTLPYFGNSLNWFWWYVVVSLPFGLVFRKMLGVEL